MSTWWQVCQIAESLTKVLPWCRPSHANRVNWEISRWATLVFGTGGTVFSHVTGLKYDRCWPWASKRHLVTCGSWFFPQCHTRTILKCTLLVKTRAHQQALFSVSRKKHAAPSPWLRDETVEQSESSRQGTEATCPTAFLSPPHCAHSKKREDARLKK